MRIVTADDEPLALEMLTEAVKAVAPDAQIVPFSNPSPLLAYAASNAVDVAFLDIRMRGISGLQLAKRLKELTPAVNLVFVTGYDEYACDAMTLHASGYVRKPVTAQAIAAELSDLRHPVAPKAGAALQIKCFGNFEVYAPDGSMVRFERSKAKELLAYLVYRSGSSCTVREIASALFEDGAYDKRQRNYTQKIIASMLQALKAVRAESVVIKNHNSLAVDVTRVDCDYYRFGAMDATAVNAYAGEFMAQYPWAEFVIGYLVDVYAKR